MQKNANCPECDAEVTFANKPIIDQRAFCPHCGSDLIVIRLNPTILDWAFSEPLSRPERSEYFDMRSPLLWDDN